MNTAVTAVGVLFAALTLVAQDDSKDKPAVYKTPQEVFDAYNAARKERDYQKMVPCLSPEAQKDMAAELALSGLALRAGNTPSKGEDSKRDRTAGSLAEVLVKHGLGEKVTKDIKPGTDHREREKAKKAVLALIKKPAAFIVDYLTVAGRFPLSGRGELPTPRLKSVKIDGDKAVGILETDDKDREQGAFVGFVRINGGWRMAPDLKDKTANEKKAKKEEKR